MIWRWTLTSFLTSLQWSKDSLWDVRSRTFPLDQQVADAWSLREIAQTLLVSPFKSTVWEGKMGAGNFNARVLYEKLLDRGRMTARRLRRPMGQVLSMRLASLRTYRASSKTAAIRLPNWSNPLESFVSWRKDEFIGVSLKRLSAAIAARLTELLSKELNFRHLRVSLLNPWNWLHFFWFRGSI